MSQLVHWSVPIALQEAIMPRRVVYADLIECGAVIAVQVALAEGIDSGAALPSAERASGEGLGVNKAAELVGWWVEGSAPAATGDRVHLLFDGEALLGDVKQRSSRAIDGDGILVELELHCCGERSRVGE
jgi:hypothetical protein